MVPSFHKNNSLFFGKLPRLNPRELNQFVIRQNFGNQDNFLIYFYEVDTVKL